MKRMIKSGITIDLDYPDNGQLTLEYTGRSGSISTYDGLLYRKVYEANDGSLWMKIDNIWSEVEYTTVGYLKKSRHCNLRKSQIEKDEERRRYENIKHGGFNPLDGI